MIRKLFLVLVSVMMLSACDRVKRATTDTINKTGETVGRGTSEFFNGVGKGFDETYNCEVISSADLTAKGLKLGKPSAGYDSAGNHNLFRIYLIFDNDFKQSVSVKVFDTKGQEYGRTSTEVSGKKGEASYVDFYFDERTRLEENSKFTLE